jgi:hypothetical protein
MKTFTLLLAIISCAQVASAAPPTPASPETQLLKLSKSIRGEPASYADRSLLQTAVAQGKTGEFLKQKTQEYLASSQFNLKLKQKVDELVRLIPQTGPLKTEEYAPAGARPSAYDLFVENLIAQNSSWDELLIGKSYRSNTTGSFMNTEKRFYEILNGSASGETSFEEAFPTEKGLVTEYTFAKADPRIAGILTTPRFFDRYVNTALNKNRRRAAAIFRIFMCDTMIPTVPAQDSKSQKTDYDKILPDHSNVTESQIRKSVAGNIHGQQADCMSCHSKLDPMGQTCGFSAATAGVTASPGTLHFTGYDGRSVDVPVSGLAQLAEEIVKQPEYEKCQVSNFWRWYIGKDVPLTQNREDELIKVFNKVGRKPKDFVAHLVTLPEFTAKPAVLTEDQILSRRVVKIFKNCNSCHASTEEDVWDLTDMPYSKDARLRERKIKALKKELDTDGDGRKAEMPPEDSLWQLSQDEFATIKKWMEHGAPDFTGTPQVTPGGAK